MSLSLGFNQLSMSGSRSGVSAPVQIGGYALEDAGGAGTIYEGFKLSAGDDFTSLNIVTPASTDGYMTTRAPMDQPGARGSQAATHYYTDPYHTGYMDSNRGEAVGFDGMSIQGGTRLKLQARKATAGEQAHFNATTVTSNLREIMSSAINTALNSGFYVGSTYDIIVEAMVRHTPKAVSPRGAHATVPWVYGAAPTRGSVNGDEWDLNEGTSQGAYFNRNVWTNGVVSSTTIGGPYDKFDGTDHLWSLWMSKSGTFCKLYIDGVLTATSAVDPNSKSKPQFLIFTVVPYVTTFKSETYTSADWTTFADGVSAEVDYYRIWRKAGAAHYRPLVSVADQNLAYNGTASIILPSKATIWGSAGVTEFVQVVGSETNAPGDVDTLAFDTLPANVTYDSGTRTLAIDWSADTTHAGRLHVMVSAWDTAGSSYEPLTFVINRGPRLSATSFNIPQTGTYDLYAICDCGVLVSDGNGNRAKTISVSGLPAGVTYSDATGLLTSTGAAATTTAISVTVTNSLGQSVTTSVDMTAVGYETETIALLARFTSEPDATRKGHINTLIAALKTAGVWTKLDYLQVLAAHDEQAARRNWKADTFNAFVSGSPTFTTDRGFTTDGATNWLDSGFNPSTSGGNFTQNSGQFGIWSRTSGQQTNAAAGWHDGTDGTTLNPRSTTDTISARASQNAAESVANLDGTGHYAINRSASNATRVYKNGASVGTGTTVSTTVNNASFKYGHVTTSTYSAREFPAGYVSGSLTTTETADLYNALSAYMTAVGAA